MTANFKVFPRISYKSLGKTTLKNGSAVVHVLQITYSIILVDILEKYIYEKCKL